MNQSRILVAFFGIGSLLWQTPARADRYAVLVGIHDYAPAGLECNSPASNDLCGVENDLELMRQTLVRGYGFDDDSRHMIKLLGTQATRTAMIDALRTMASRVGRGDEFVFFYSGHGTYRKDENGDEADGWDEAIVPTDLKDIVDDELHDLLGAIHGKKTVIFDSCFSGTATRDVTKRTRRKSLSRRPKTLRRGTRDSGSGLKEITKGGLDHVLIAGCRSNQLSNVTWLGKWQISALTFALCQALLGSGDENRDGEITYREAASYARQKVSEKYPETRQHYPEVGREDVFKGQTIQLEGSDTTRAAFGIRHFRPLRPRLLREGGRQMVDVGAAHGFKDGSTFQTDNGTKVQITTLGLFESQVTLLGGDDDSGDGGDVDPIADPLPAESVVLNVRISVLHNDADLIEAARRVAHALQNEAFVHVEDQNDAPVDVAVRLERASGRVTYSLVYPGGRIETARTTAGTDFGVLLGNLREALATAFAIRRMQDLENPHASFSVRLATDRGEDNPSYRISEQMQLRVSVTEPCYVTLVDIGTSGQLSILYPPPGRQPPRLAPGRPLVLPRQGASISVQGPTGLDRIKAIATKRPLTLGDIVHTKGTGLALTRRADGILSALRGLGRPIGAKGLGDVGLPNDAWAESSIGIEIRSR